MLASAALALLCPCLGLAAQPEPQAEPQPAPVLIDISNRLPNLIAPEKPAYPEVRLRITANAPDEPATPPVIINTVPAVLPAPAFTPVEAAGLVAQLTSISASVSLNLHHFGHPGVQEYRTLSLNGTLSDLSGTRAFRIVGVPHLVELTDEQGNDLRDDATWTLYPDITNIQPFTRPQDSGGGMLQQSFALSTSNIQHIPAGLTRLRIDMDVAVGGQPEQHTLRAVVTHDFQPFAPGIEARITRLTTESGQTTLGLEYRLSDAVPPTEPASAGLVGADQPTAPNHMLAASPTPRPWFFELEVLDDELRTLHRQQGAQEAIAATATLGAVTIWGIDTTAAPVCHVRLHIVRSSDLVHITLDHDNLPLLSN